MRGEGLRAEIERFSEFANILFLKLLNETNPKSRWDALKVQQNDDLLDYVNGHVITHIQQLYGGDVFTPLSIKNPKIFRYIIEQIDPLKLSTIDRDVKGDALGMNMILHGDGHSGVQQIDSLAKPVDGQYDAVITNIPFSQKITNKVKQNGKTKTENHISPLYYNGIGKNNGDAACVLHCLRALKEGGRMALVVSEGFLFRRDTAGTRGFLLSKAKLQSVILLPQGVFLPYTGVKTDILYFANAHKPNTQKSYWFFDVKNIGVTLDNHKRKIKGGNDLNKIVSSDLQKLEKQPELASTITEIGFEQIDLAKVKQNNWNLVGSVFNKNEICNNVSMIAIGELCEIVNGGTPNTKPRPLNRRTAEACRRARWLPKNH